MFEVNARFILVPPEVQELRAAVKRDCQPSYLRVLTDLCEHCTVCILIRLGVAEFPCNKFQCVVARRKRLSIPPVVKGLPGALKMCQRWSQQSAPPDPRQRDFCRVILAIPEIPEKLQPPGLGYLIRAEAVARDLI